MKKRVPTGRTRHRVHTRWFRKPLLVLQREYQYIGEDLVSEGGQLFDRPYDYTVWEDAGPYVAYNEDLRGKGEK